MRYDLDMLVLQAEAILAQKLSTDRLTSDIAEFSAALDTLTSSIESAEASVNLLDGEQVLVTQVQQMLDLKIGSDALSADIAAHDETLRSLESSLANLDGLIDILEAETANLLDSKI